ncbi:MAG: hypothetical protein FWD66_10685 [Paludibacter sp.]|nr:hypothetical protein [Paludibacter sp.]
MKEINQLYQTAKDLILTNRLAKIIAIVLSVYFIFRAGQAVGEFVYYLKK